MLSFRFILLAQTAAAFAAVASAILTAPTASNNVGGNVLGDSIPWSRFTGCTDQAWPSISR